MARETVESLIAAMLEEAAYRVRRDTARAPEKWRPVFAQLERRFFDPDLRLRSLRQQLGVITPVATRAFETVFGCEPNEYVTHLRIDTVAELLRIVGLTVWKCGGVGFTSRGGFEAAYVRRRRETPTATRERLAKEGAMITPEPPAEKAALRRLLWLEPTFDQAVAACEDLRSRAAAALKGPAAAAKARTERAEAWWRLAREEPRREQRRLAAGWFETPAMFERLCRAAREEGRDDRRRGLEIARLALKSLLPLHGVLEPDQLTQLEARAWAEIGTAYRLVRDFQAADQAFAWAEQRLEKCSVAAPMLAVDVLGRKAYLYRDEHRLDQALDLAQRAFALAEPAGCPGAEILLCRGSIYLDLDQLPEAIGDFRAAFELLLPLEEPYLAWAAGHSLAKTFYCAGNIAEARTWLERAEPAVRALGQRGPLALFNWQLGLILWTQGDKKQAEKHLQRAHGGYETLNDVGHATVASLDLALLYLDQGRPVEASRLAAEALPQLRDLGLDTEGLLALNLLHQALEAEQLAAAVLEKVRACASRVVGAPDLRTG